MLFLGLFKILCPFAPVLHVKRPRCIQKQKLFPTVASNNSSGFCIFFSQRQLRIPFSPCFPASHWMSYKVGPNPHAKCNLPRSVFGLKFLCICQRSRPLCLAVDSVSSLQLQATGRGTSKQSTAKDLIF